MWVCHRRPVDADVEVVTKTKERLTRELSSVVGDDGVRHPKPINDVSEERSGLCRSDLGDGLCLDPFGELVHGYE